MATIPPHPRLRDVENAANSMAQNRALPNGSKNQIMLVASESDTEAQRFRSFSSFGRGFAI